MVRKLTMAVALALGSASFSAQGLGLGDIEADSRLNEPFRGSIGLLSVNPDELEGVRVRLASHEEFERAGVGRPAFLSNLKFEPRSAGARDAVISITSDTPIREPFLNFLVEVNWPQGRLIREYTVLLDPPVTTTRRPAPVATPEIVARPVTPAAPEPAPAVTTSVTPPAAAEPEAATPATYGPIRANETMWAIASNLRPGGVTTEQMIIALQRANPGAFINGNVNLLKKGQILRVPGQDEIGVSPGEARAEFLAQQDEWLASTKPAAPATAPSVTEPAPEVAAPDDAELRIAAPRPEGEGDPGAGEDDAARAVSEDLEQELILAREKAESARLETDNLRGQLDDLERQIGDMQRLLSLKDEQLAQLQASVQEQQEAAEVPEVAPPEAPAPAPEADAETEVAGESPAVAPDTVPEPVEEALPPATEETAPDTTAAETPPVADEPAEVAAEPVVEPETTTAEPTAEPTPTESTATQPETESSTTGLYDPGTVKTPDAEPAVAQTPPPEPAAPEPTPKPDEPAVGKPAAEPVSAAPTATAGPWYTQLPVVGGIAALALLVLGWLFARGRSSEPATAEGPALAGAAEPFPALDASEAQLEPDTQELAEAVAASEDDSGLLSRLGEGDDSEPLSGLDAVHDDTGEVDPVSEADVYIAYGRYQQAEELLRQALNREPDRLTFKHKLLEVLYATKKSAAFTELAQGMVDSGQDGVDPEAWVRVAEMGRDLDPDAELFQPAEPSRLPERDLPTAAAAAAGIGAVAGATAVDTDSGIVDRDSGILGLDSGIVDADSGIDELSELVSELRIDEPVDSDSAEEMSEADLSLELDQLTREVEQTIDAVDSAHVNAEDLESLDLDLPTVHADERTFGKTAAGDELDTLELPDDSLEAPTDTVDEPDVIPSLMTDDVGAPVEPMSELDSALDDLSDLTSLDTDMIMPGDTSGLDALEPASELAPDAADSEIPSQIGDESVADLGEPVADGDGFDDVETKLDLARAYVEMGDTEGARSILDEVKQEGNDNQKSQADQILMEIGA